SGVGRPGRRRRVGGPDVAAPAGQSASSCRVSAPHHAQLPGRHPSAGPAHGGRRPRPARHLRPHRAATALASRCGAVSPCQRWQAPSCVTGLWLPGLLPLASLLLVLYPDGRLPAHWWRWPFAAAALGMALLTLGSMLARRPTRTSRPARRRCACQPCRRDEGFVASVRRVPPRTAANRRERL